MSRSPLTLGGAELNITLLAEELDEENKIRVIGLTPSVTKHVLEAFFDNPKYTGGGDVTAVEVSDDGTHAVVAFADNVSAQFQNTR